MAEDKHEPLTAESAAFCERLAIALLSKTSQIESGSSDGSHT